NRTLYATALASSVGLWACWHSTQLAATWREPNAGTIHFRQPIAVFVSKSETFRRMMEDKLVAQMPNGVQSYRIIHTDNITDGEAIREQLAKAGFDGAVIMRVADVQDRVVYSPGSYWYGGPPYYSFAGYWGTAWGYPYDPSYVTTDKIVSIETQI